VAKIYYEKDADQSYLNGKTVAVIGYGSQGHAQAQNLRDSGVRVIVGLRPGRSWEQAEKDGFEVYPVDEATAKADFVQILMPDEIQAKVYREQIEPNLKSGAVLSFSHGFNIHFGQIVPPENVDVVMIAPKGPGHLVRRVYEEGFGVPALIAVHQNASGQALEIGLAYAKAIGATKAGVIETTFKEETETDLFGEQAVLCGGISELIKAGFETLVEAGYQPEVAYFECLHEMKLIVDLMYEGGIGKMYWSVSDTAEYGGYTRGPRVITDETKQAMRKILEQVKDGSFVRELIEEFDSGQASFKRYREELAAHPIEKTGAKLRPMMSWLKNEDA